MRIALGKKVRFICKRREENTGETEKRYMESKTEMRCGGERREERASSLWTGRLIPNMEQIKCMTQIACL